MVKKPFLTLLVSLEKTQIHQTFAHFIGDFTVAGNDFGTPSITDFLPSFSFSFSQFFFTSSASFTLTSL